MMRIHPLVALSLILFATGCGPDLRAFEEVESEFKSPSGALDSSNIGQVFNLGRKTNDAEGLTSGTFQFDERGATGSALGHRDDGLGTNRDALQGCNVNLNVGTTGTVNKVTVTCTSNAEFSGEISFEYEEENDQVIAVYLRMKEWCGPQGCATGWVGWQTKDKPAEDGFTQKVLLVADLELSSTTGESARLEWAIRTLEKIDAFRGEVLLFAEADGQTVSFVLSNQIDPAGGTLSVKANNGEFTCNYTGEGESGTCTNSGGDTLTWTQNG